MPPADSGRLAERPGKTAQPRHRGEAQRRHRTQAPGPGRPPAGDGFGRFETQRTVPGFSGSFPDRHGNTEITVEHGGHGKIFKKSDEINLFHAVLVFVQVRFAWIAAEFRKFTQKQSGTTGNHTVSRLFRSVFDCL